MVSARALPELLDTDMSLSQLGNVGVIAAGLIIWLTKSPYRFYSDPIISFVITIIIFSSALPLGELAPTRLLSAEIKA